MTDPSESAMTSAIPGIKWSGRLIWVTAGLLGLVVVRNAWVAHEYRQSLFALRCNEPIFDFETAFSGDDRDHVFRVTNVSRRPVHITSVMAECGCTTVAADLQGRTIASQESFDVPITLSLAGAAPGMLEKRVLIRFDDDPARKLTLKITGAVEAAWIWSPQRVFFEDAPADRSVTRIVTVRRHPSAPPASIEYLTTSRFISVESANQSGSDDANTWSIRLKTSPPLPPGRQEASLFLQTTERAGYSVVIPVTILPASGKNQTAEQPSD